MPDQNPQDSFESKGNFNLSNPLSSQSAGNDNVEIKSKSGNTAGSTSDTDEVMQKNLKIDKKISNDQQNTTSPSEPKPDTDKKPASQSKSDSQSKATQKQDSEPTEKPEKKTEEQPAEQKQEQEPDQLKQPEDQQAEEEQQDDNGPDRPDKKEEPEEQAEDEPAKEEPAEEQPAEEQPEAEAQTEEAASEEPAGEATDAAGQTGENLSTEGTDAAGGSGEGLSTGAVDAAGGSGEGLSTGAVDAAGGTGEALTTATPAAGAASEAAAAGAEAAVATAEAEAAGAGVAAGGWIPIVVILAILVLIFIIMVIVGFVKSKTTTDKNDPTQAEQITIMQDNISSGNIVFDNSASKTLIDEGNVGFQALSTMNHLAERHKPLKIHFAGTGSTATTKQNEAYEFDVLEVDMIKCTNTSTSTKSLEVPIVLDVTFNWSSILSGNDPNLLCAGGYYPGIETPSQGKYSTTFNPGEFKLSTIAQSGPALAQEKTAEIIDETVLQNEQEGISAQSDKSLLPKTILLNTKYAQTNILKGTDGVSKTLQTIIEQNYTDITLGRGITSDDTITGLHIAFD